MTSLIKGERPYDATGRRAQAEQRRNEVLKSARALFLERGYASTTIAAVAAASGVSVETVYKTFGGKPGIVRTIFEMSLLGSGPGAAESRSDAAQLAATDSRALFERLGQLSGEVAPLTAPIVRLIRDAATGGDISMAALLRDVESKRHERMLHIAEVVESRGFLRPGLTADHAADVMWFYTADDVFHNLVMSRGWPLKAYERFIAEALIAALSTSLSPLRVSVEGPCG